MAQTKSSNSSLQTSNGPVFVLTYAVLLALLSAVAVISLFLAGFGDTLWMIAFPIGVFIMSFVCNIVGQLSVCSSVSPTTSISNAVYPLVASTVAFVASSFILFFRMPVISFVLRILEWITGEVPKNTIVVLEKQTPLYKGLGISFWVFWSVLMAQIVSGTASLIC